MSGSCRGLVAWGLVVMALSSCAADNEGPYVRQGPVIATATAKSKLAPPGANVAGAVVDGGAAASGDCSDPDDPDCVTSDAGY